MANRKIVTFKNILGEWVAADGVFECYGATEAEAIEKLKARRRQK